MTPNPTHIPQAAARFVPPATGRTRSIMRAIVWSLFAVLLAAWSGMAWLAVELAGWSAQALGSLQAGRSALEPTTAALAAWLALWVSPELLDATAATARWLLQLPSAVLPTPDTASGGWLAMLPWIAWACGAALLLAAALTAHVALSRWMRPGTAASPKLPTPASNPGQA